MIQAAALAVLDVQEVKARIFDCPRSGGKVGCDTFLPGAMPGGLGSCASLILPIEIFLRRIFGGTVWKIQFVDRNDLREFFALTRSNWVHHYASLDAPQELLKLGELVSHHPSSLIV